MRTAARALPRDRRSAAAGRARGSAGARDPRFPVYAHTKLWKVGTSCRR